MYEFEIYNKTTFEETIIFGYNFADACRRANIKATEWHCVSRVYVD